MPFVSISLIEGKSPAHIRAVADGVHQGLVETFNVPTDDRFQVIQQHAPGALIYDADYMGIHRTDDLVLINITASTGRSTAQKQALYRAITDRLVADPGLRPQDVLIVLSPNAREDWSFGNGVASYVTPGA